MKKMSFILSIQILVFMLASVAAYAGNFPNVIGGVKIGQRGVIEKIVKNVSFVGYKGEVTVYLSENKTVDTIRFGAMDCNELSAEECDKHINQLHMNFTKEIGEPIIAMDTITKDVVWEENGRRLTLRKDFTGGLGEEIAIYLERTDETKPGGKQDGFSVFYGKFRQAVMAKNVNKVAEMMKFPFSFENTLEIRNQKDLKTHFKKISSRFKNNLEAKPVFIRYTPSTDQFTVPRMYFSGSSSWNGFGFAKVGSAWKAVGFWISE